MIVKQTTSAICQCTIISRIFFIPITHVINYKEIPVCPICFVLFCRIESGGAQLVDWKNNVIKTRRSGGGGGCSGSVVGVVTTTYIYLYISVHIHIYTYTVHFKCCLM